MERDRDHNPEEEERKTVDGITYRRVNTGYTIRQYFSHSTEEKGPGPGWDYRWDILEKYKIREPIQLPDEPYYVWEEVRDDEL